VALLPKVPQMQRSVNGFRLNHTKSGVRFQRRESGNRKNAAWQDARRASKPRVILLDTNVVSPCFCTEMWGGSLRSRAAAALGQQDFAAFVCSASRVGMARPKNAIILKSLGTGPTSIGPIWTKI